MLQTVYVVGMLLCHLTDPQNCYWPGRKGSVLHLNVVAGIGSDAPLYGLSVRVVVTGVVRCTVHSVLSHFGIKFDEAPQTNLAPGAQR